MPTAYQSLDLLSSWQVLRFVVFYYHRVAFDISEVSYESKCDKRSCETSYIHDVFSLPSIAMLWRLSCLQLPKGSEICVHPARPKGYISLHPTIKAGTTFGFLSRSPFQPSGNISWCPGHLSSHSSEKNPARIIVTRAIVWMSKLMFGELPLSSECLRMTEYIEIKNKYRGPMDIRVFRSNYYLHLQHLNGLYIHWCFFYANSFTFLVISNAFLSPLLRPIEFSMNNW